MKKLCNFMVWRAVAMAIALTTMVGCNVDDSYDLSNLDTDNVGIGTDDTEFYFPLVTVQFNVEELIKGNDGVLDDMGTKADVDIPADVATTSKKVTASELLTTVDDMTSFLPEDYGAIDLKRINEEEYVGELTTALIGELSTDSSKRTDFCQFSIDSQVKYPEVYDTLVDVLPEEDINDTKAFSDSLGELLNDKEMVEKIEQVKSSVTATVAKETADFETEFLIKESFDPIDIDSSTIDMIDSNLDGDKNTLSILYILDTDLPLSMKFVPYIIFNDGERVKLSDYCKSHDLASTISSGDFRDMLDGLAVEVEVEFENYNPLYGDLKLEGKMLTIKLIALKRGSLKF